MYFLNGFFPGLITGVSFFIVQAYSPTKLEESAEIRREIGWYCGVALGMAVTTCLFIYLLSRAPY